MSFTVFARTSEAQLGGKHISFVNIPQVLSGRSADPGVFLNVLRRKILELFGERPNDARDIDNLAPMPKGVL